MGTLGLRHLLLEYLSITYNLRKISSEDIYSIKKYENPSKGGCYEEVIEESNKRKVERYLYTCNKS